MFIMIYRLSRDPSLQTSTDLRSTDLRSNHQTAHANANEIRLARLSRETQIFSLLVDFQ